MRMKLQSEYSVEDKIAKYSNVLVGRQPSGAVLHLLSSEAWGGLELYVCRLADEMAHAGMETYLACNPDSRTGAFAREKNIFAFPFIRHSYPSLIDIIRLREFVQTKSISIVHTHYHSDVLTASLALHGPALQKVKLFHSAYMGIARKLDAFHRAVYDCVDGLFVSIPKFATEVKERIAIDPEKVHVLHYGRDLSSFEQNPSARKEIRHYLDIPDDEMLVGTMARIDPGKGIREFVESFLELKPSVRQRTSYLVIGEPTIKGLKPNGTLQYEPKCEAYNRDVRNFVSQNKLEKNIKFIGFKNDYVPYLDAMDVFVLASHDEAYSLSVLDAMAMNLPVIGTNSGGTPYQISDGVSGLLVEPKSPDAIARAIERYFENPALRAEHGRNGRMFVEEEHSFSKTLSTLKNFYFNESS